MRALGRLTGLAIPLLLGGAAAFAGEPLQEKPPAGATCVVEKATSPQPRGPEAPPRRFSVAEVSSLELVVQAAPPRRGQPPSPQVELRVYTPQGHLYQRLRGASSYVEPRSADVKVRRQRITFRLPVAGSPIVTHSLYGHWRVEPYLAGAESPCGEARRFWITR